jgi:hypothetical protein
MTMNARYLLAFLLLPIFLSGAAGFNAPQVEESALSGFKELLDDWRSEDYEGLYARLKHPPEQGWDYFAGRIVHASRIPACCWEQLQKVRTEAAGPDRVVIYATLGLEEEGVGTRFVTRAFVLERIDGVWKAPMGDILELSRYNLQRVPRKIYEREP